MRLLFAQSKTIFYTIIIIIIPNLLFSREQALSIIEASAFQSIMDPELQVTGNTTRASVKLPSFRGCATALEIFETVFGAWVADTILPELNANIDRIGPDHAKKQQPRWHHFNFVQLMAFFLYQLLAAIQEQPKRVHNWNKCAELMGEMVSEISHKVICAALNFHGNVLTTILDGIPFALQRLVTLGGVVVVDEAIWSYHSPAAKKNKIIRHLPSKPHKDGMLTYLLCQRLHFTGHPISLAFAPTWLGSAPTPHEALMALNVTLLRSGFDRPADWILVTDSLWSYPKHILDFLEIHWQFVISAKDNTTVIPSQLRAFASESLRYGFSRTFTDKFLTLQLYHGEQGVTAVVSNMASRANTPLPGELPKLSYKSALTMFENDSPAAIIHAFGLSDDLLSLTPAQLVHRVTGWDVLRSITLHTPPKCIHSSLCCFLCNELML